MVYRSSPVGCEYAPPPHLPYIRHGSVHVAYSVSFHTSVELLRHSTTTLLAVGEMYHTLSGGPLIHC